jgi:hypothetical protein
LTRSLDSARLVEDFSDSKKHVYFSPVRFALQWMEACMAKKKLEVSLTPIATQIDKAAAKLKSLKSRVSKADGRKIDSELKDLVKARKLVVHACGGKMTPVFAPKPEQE